MVKCLFSLLIFLLLSLESSLYILDLSTLWDVWFVNISSQFVTYILFLLTQLFVSQNLLILSLPLPNS